MSRYRLIVRAPNGELLGRAAPDSIELPEHNANAQLPFTVAIQEQCNMGHWHDTDIPVTKLPHWGGEVTGRPR